MSDSHDSQQEARALVARLVEDRSIEQFSAKELLQQYSALRQFPDCVVDLAYEEYCRRRENGEELNGSSFVQGYSTVAQSLYRVIEFDQLLHDHPSLVKGVSEARWPDEGMAFSDFKIVEQIGRGALSRVYIARQPDLGNRRVIVKVCVRGELEADYLGMLEHSAIASIYSVHRDSETGLTVICMPLETRLTLHQVAEMQPPLPNPWKGQTLRKAIAGQNQGIAIPTPAAVEELQIADSDTMAVMVIKWGLSLAQALTYAHRKEIFHCDVKPGNVLILSNMEVQLLDFNLAANAAAPIRLAGGTLPFMAPEQLHQLLDDGSDKPIGPATDVFGLCATLWHMVTGAPPFGVVVDHASRSRAAQQMLERHRCGIPAERIETAGNPVARQVLTVLQQGLNLSTQDRFMSPAELGHALAAILPAEVRRVRRRRVLVTMLGGVAAIAATGFAIQSRQSVTHARETAIKQYLDGRYQAAEQTLAPYIEDDQEAWFLLLVARSSGLESLDSSRIREDPLPEDPLILGWLQLVADWKQYTDRYPDDGCGFFNLALVHLEFAPQPGAYAKATAAIDAAIHQGLNMPRVSLMRDIIDLRQRAGKEPVAALILEFERLLGEAEHQTLTRGEFVAFLDAVCRIRNENRDQSSDQRYQRLANRIVELLSTPDRRLSEISVAGWLRFPREFRYAVQQLMFLEAESRSRNRAGEHNRLRTALIGPQADGPP